MVRVYAQIVEVMVEVAQLAKRIDSPISCLPMDLDISESENGQDTEVGGVLEKDMTVEIQV